MIKVSVVIPTKNGGVQFQHVIQSVLSQVTPWGFDILVIDSGSKDDTVEYCRKLSVPVHSIPPQEFGHGKTRNLGISLTCGEFIAFLTQDALPASQTWLADLVQAVEQSPDVAGAFGRHLPYPDLDPYTTRDINLVFDGFLAGPQIMRNEDPDRYRVEQGYRQWLHFFSSNNSCIRRRVWEKYPLPNVEFAEDQIWAKTIIEAGYAKAYADTAAVYHSHNFSVMEAGRRAFDESTALHGSFGYNLCPNILQMLGQTVWCTIRDIRYSASMLKIFFKTELWISGKRFLLHIQNGNLGGIFNSIIPLLKTALFLFTSKKIWALLFFGMRSLFFNLSRQIGLYLGNKESKLPTWLSNYISFDHTLKTGNRRQKNTENEDKNMPITDIKQLKNGCPYKVVGGIKNGHIFVYSSGHKRRVLTMQNYYRYFSDDDLQNVSPGVEESLPFGAPLPINDGSSLGELLKGKDTDAIREALCVNFSGTGYEIGAGERPTRIPISANVSYIDKFTFEEAKDGSFIGKRPDNFVKVSVFEAMDSLDSIENGTSDFFVACHVIEHVPNVIASLKSVLYKLRKGGEIVLIVPDKRYMFDQGRPETTLEHFLADEIRGSHAETLEHYIEYFRRAAAKEDYLELALAGFESGRDIHMHVFTPESMRLLLIHLQMKMEFEEFMIWEPLYPETLIEFYVRIRK